MTTIFPSSQASRAFFADLVFDIYENETHASTAKVTTHPVERGARITDHVVQESDTLTLVARVSNTPIVSEAAAQVIGATLVDNVGLIDRAYERLKKMKTDGEAITVFTNLRTYENMVIVSASVQRDASTGDALATTIQLVEIRTVENLVLAVPTPTPTGNAKVRGKAKVDKGKQPTKPAPAPVAEKSRTVANNAFHGLLNSLGVSP